MSTSHRWVGGSEWVARDAASPTPQTTHATLPHQQCGSTYLAVFTMMQEVGVMRDLSERMHLGLQPEHVIVVTQTRRNG